MYNPSICNYLGGGYICEFVGNTLMCPMCHSPFCDPHTVICCNKTFCKRCIELVKQNNGLCPECKKEVEFYPNEELNARLRLHNTNKYGKNCMKFKKNNICKTGTPVNTVHTA